MLTLQPRSRLDQKNEPTEDSLRIGTAFADASHNLVAASYEETLIVKLFTTAVDDSSAMVDWLEIALSDSGAEDED